MKKSVIIFLLLASIQITFSQDSTAGYYPLKIGNMWSYNHYWAYSGNTRIVHRIIDTAILGGHKYFKMRRQAAPPSTGFYDSYIRIDSSTGSIRAYTTSGGCPWLVNEFAMDSLRGVFPDSAKYNCQATYSRMLRDTVLIVLGTNRFVKRFHTDSYFEFANYRAFVYGLGVLYDVYYGNPGSYNRYDLRGCFINGVVYGDTSLTNIEFVSSQIPEDFSLSQNYPNPFNPETNISFNIPLLRGVDVPSTRDGRGVLVKLSVYDILGKQVAELVNQNLQPGTYEVNWNAADLPSGVYFYTLKTDEYSITKKMLLIK